MLKCVVMNMDGIVIDDKPLLAKAMISTMKKYNITLSEEFCKNFSDCTQLHMIDAIKRIYNIPQTAMRLLIEYSDTCHVIFQKEGIPATPYIIEFIQDLYQNKIEIALVSSFSVDVIEKVLSALNIRPYISQYVSLMDIANPKPAPDIYLRLIELMQIVPQDYMVVEDTHMGIQAAKAANMACIGFLNNNTGNQYMNDVDYVIEGFQEVGYKFIHQIYQRIYNESITIAATKRLIIRELSLDDIKSMYTIYQSKEIRQYIDDIDDYLNIEIEKHKAYIKNIYCFYDYGYWGVFNKEDGKLIGRCGIQNNLIDGIPEIELGYLLDVKHWGNGYAQECSLCVLSYAFEELNIPRIVAIIDKSNLRSQRVALALGMKIERETIKNGRTCDLYVITPADFNHSNISIES